MKFERTQTFVNEWARLTEVERALALEAVRSFVRACNDAERDGKPPRFPTKLRVKGVKGTPGVMEMTWNFRRPDGRATWQWIEIDGVRAVRWRRLGGHEIFKDA